MRVPERPVAGSFVRAALTALGLWAVALTAHTVVTAGPVPAARRFPYIIVGGVLFGLPVIATVVAGIALPAFVLLRRTRLLSFPISLALGAACGLIAREAVRRLWGAPESDFVPLTVVLVAGLATAAVWWRAWRGGTGAPGRPG